MNEKEDGGSPAVRPPLQARSRRTLDRIVEAALDILAEEGTEGATVQAIVDRAGSSVGSFYARFEGKDALLDHLENRIWAGATTRWEEAVAEGRLHGEEVQPLVEGVVRLLLAVDRTHARQRRALAGRPGYTGDAAAAAFLRTVRLDVRRAVLGARGDIRHPDPGRAVDLAFRAVLGTLRELRNGPAGEPPELNEEGLVRELTRMVLGYLGSETAAAAEGEQVDFFDVWG